MTCDAKIRPFPNDTEMQCERDDHSDEWHSADLRDYAYPGSVTKISWAEYDRRTFRGAWTPCPHSCSLPAGHRGNHAP